LSYVVTIITVRSYTKYKKIYEVKNSMKYTNIIKLFIYSRLAIQMTKNYINTRMWDNAQRDGRPAEHRWRPLFNAAKFG